MMRPIVVDLFCGAGGMSLGFEQAGFDVVAAVEIDPVHAAVHKFNFPNCATLCRDISKISGNEIRKAAGIENRRVDVVVGGAPCQGFSLIGQRALDDPRNKLVSDYVRIVCELDARYFVFENVKGLTLGRHKEFLNELVATFERRGYNVRKEWKVLNASDYGVPQERERLILLGAKRGLRLPNYPKYSKVNPTTKDALGDLPDADEYDELLGSDMIELPAKAWKNPSFYAMEMRCRSNSAWHYGYVRNWNPRLLTSSMRTVHTEISRRRFAETMGGDTEPISRFFKLPANGCANTLRAGTDAARGAFTSPRPIHFRHARCVTVREMARLHGFPDWFRFHETKWHGARQIGNAVPPPLARVIGRSVMAAMAIRPRAPSKVIDLGGDELVRMDMSAASRFWHVERPIGKRDRKSGAKKRPQYVTEMMRLAQQVAAE
jgi:DNA (cytosine-5)-methyltransferase 1